MANSLDVWVVLLDEIMGHVQKFVDDNPINYKGKELKAYVTGLGMVSVLCKAMLEDIMGDKRD
tara:strand:- start:1231 stop:1419 length:189 start_codon:yes stop_codon:yes gene_type:complete